MEFESAGIAFIKQPGSLFIDSIEISTSVDKIAYGFSFPEDTLLLDIEILLPVDELTIETFSNGQSHGKRNCWVDPPSANVYLSVNEGAGQVDSVGLSGIDRWFQQKVQEVIVLQDIELRKYELSRTILNLAEDLIVVRFIEAYLSMPNLTSADAYYLWQAMEERFIPIRRHPDFQVLMRHATLLGNQRPALLKKLTFRDAKKRKRELAKPTSDYFLLEIYDQHSPVSQQNHRILMRSKAIDSLLQIVPMISLTNEESHALWSLYVKDGKFKWLHGMHAPTARVPSLARWAIFPNATYLLVDKKFNLVGAYPDLPRMAAGVWWYTKVSD